MRFIKRSIASLLFICMLFTVMPAEVMTAAFADGGNMIGSTVQNDGPRGNENYLGGTAQTDSVEFRIVLSRNENTYLNGTDEQRNKVVSYYKSRWPNDSDLESNTIYLISPRTANWFNTYNSIPSGHRRWVAQYKPGEQGLSFFAGYYRSLLIDLTNGNPGSSVPENPFKEDVMNAYYNGDINSLSDLAVGNKWLDYMPSASEAMSVLNYIFAQVGGSYQVDSRLTNVIERKTTHYNFDVENNWSKDPSLLDADRKMDISAGYVGLLTCLYSVITSTYNYSFNQEHINTTDDEVGVREKVGGTYFDAINDYLLNANSETKPVSLIIDTASGFVYQNDKNFILADIDYLQFVGLAEQNEALTNPNNQILANNSAANGNTRQLLTTMYNMSLNRKSWKDYYAGRGPSAVVRYLDYYLGRMGEISHAPMQWAYSAQFFDNQILRTRDGGAYNGQHTGTSTSDYSGKIEHILFDGTKGSGTSGFMIIGNHFVNPVPEVSYHVDSTVDVLPKDCDPDVNIENPSVITVSIKGDSSLISSLNSRKDNPNFEGIKIDSEIYRTVYKNGWEDGNIIDARKQMSELENQLDGVINGDDMIAKLQNEPFILRDTTIIGEKLTRDMGAGGSYRYKYEINIDVTIDKQTYEFKYEDIVLKGRGGADRDYYDFAEINLPAYTNMLSKPEDIVIVKPTSTDTTEIVDPSKDENLRENTQMVKRMEFSSSGEEFAEIKSNVPLNEEYEVMGGIPSSEEIYFSVGGSEFKLALVMQYWMNEHSRDRTYTVHFDGNICEYNNDIEGQGDRLPLTHPILQPTGGSYDDQDIKCNNENHTGDFDDTIVAKWTGTDQCSVVENGTCSDCGKKLVSSCTVADGKHPNYDKAMEQAKEYAQKLGQEYVVWTAASDGKLRQVLWTPSNPEDDDTHDHVYHGTNGTSGSSCGGNHSSCSSTSSKHSHSNTNCVYGTPCNTAHAYTIIVTSTIPKHSICGPCCGHHMPELWDTWRQGLVYDFAKISQVRLFKLDQGSVDGLQELTGVDTVFANVISGNPTYFMNIAQMTEKQTKNGTVLPDGYDSTVNDSTKGLNEFDGHILTYFSGQNRQLAQSSRAGRLRYTLAEGQTTETITITEQGNGTGGTYTFDPNLIAAPNQHDDVIYNAGARSKNCDGMATTANFGKKDTENVVPMLTTGHVNEWADGCLYTNILNRTVHQLPDGFGMSKNTSAYSGYWDCDLYSATTDTQNFEANTLQTYSNNDEHITKYKEDYNHHVVREEVLSGVSTELKKTAYNDAADEIDTQTAEWQFFDKARRTKVIANVISDFLILQTSGGDQSIFYYEKASEPTEAQEHFQKVKIDENELFLNNPLSLFTGDMNCNSTDVKSTHTANFIMVGGYNGQYNKPTEKYKPYNPQEGVFKNFGGNNGANWTNYNTRTKQGSYNVLGNHSITTILDEDPAKTITRPKRQVTGQDDSFKIVQTGIQILPTAPNKLYTPENAKVFYSEVLGYYSIDKERFDREAGTYDIVTTSGNVSIGWPQQVSHGDYYQEYWGNKNGVDYSTLYFKTPIGDSSTGTVNSLVVFTPVSTEEAMVMNQPDLDINGMKVSRDQRTNAFEYPNMNDLVNKLKVCPLDPELCEFRFLDCKFHKDTVLLDIDFEDTYMEKEIRRVKQEDGTVKETVKEIGLRENATRYDETLKRWITTNKVNGVEYILPEGFTIGKNGSVGSGGYLRANGTRWSLPFSEFGLSNANTNRITVKMDITVNSWANNLMPVSFHNLGFLLNNGSGKTGSFITKSPLDNSQIGARMDVGTSQLPNNITLEMTFSFNNVVDCNAVVNGVYVPLTVSDLKDVWQPDANGVRRLNRTQKSITPTSFTRNEINKVETPQNWIDEQPSCYTKKDIGSNLNIGGWSQDDAYKANFSIDNLQVILKGGTNTHSSICYERLTVHATNKIHVHDEDCYLKEPLFTCDGALNANYQLGCEWKDDKIVYTKTQTFGYTGTEQVVELQPGTYTIEMQGGSGGNSSTSYIGGAGGYGKFTYTVTQKTTLYLNAGASGNNYSLGAGTVAYNGGGSTNYSNERSGGGATSIAFVSGQLKTLSGKTSQILAVVGGGGAADQYSGNGYGGGGFNSNGNASSTSGAGKTTGGGTNLWNTSSTYSDGNGSFGQGGSNTWNNSVAAGGGGYYGGGVGNGSNGGGGGSGYLNTSKATLVSTNNGATGSNNGNGYVKITTNSGNGFVAETGIPVRYDFINNYTTVSLEPGIYSVELYGAEGGSYSTTLGSKGTYVRGELSLDKTTTVYVYVGGKGNTGNNTAGGYNGGGQAGGCSCGSGSGGGASDIRIGGTALSNRVMVAGGGGGAGTSGNAGKTTAKSCGTLGTGERGHSSNDGGGGGGGYHGGYTGQTIDVGGYIGTSYVNGTEYTSDVSTDSYEVKHNVNSGNGYIVITSKGHRHIGTAGLDYANGCYTTPTVHKHNLSYTRKDLTCTIPEDSDGTVYTYNYKGSVVSETLPAGRYKLEVWGAQGSGNGTGGSGGYATGEVTLKSNTTVYIAVGGKGKTFNGGGTGDHGYGGGATHIGLKNSQLSGYSSDYSTKLYIVAGGGGGASSTTGGSGGGANASGGKGGTGCGTPGDGATTSAAGQLYYNGSFGQGGNGGKNSCGGGGGFYGGGASYESYTRNDDDDAGGGGGSGYANTSLLTSISGSNGTKTGDGQAKITRLTHTHTETCYKTTNYSSTCETLPIGHLVCTGELNTETDFNVHIHTAECLTTTATFDAKWFRYTGGVQTFVVPYTDYYTIEAYGPSTTTSGRSGYSKVRTYLKANTVLYIYVGGIAGYNNYTTDVRTYPLPNSSDNVDGNSIADLTAISDKTKLLYANRTDSNKGANSACAVELLQREIRGNSENGRVIITCENTAMEDIYNKIITGQMTHEEAKKYLGETVYNKIMEGKEGLLHTWEDWTYNNTKGFTEVQNSKLLYGGASLICGKTENDPGTPIEIKYSGKIETVNLPAGEYKLEVWGAQGGGHSYPNSNNTSYGGYGGYSSGTINLNSPTTLYVAVGGSGGYTELGNYTSYHNGYNGGGNVTLTPNGNDGSAGGGGATHIATRTGLLSSLNSYRSDVLIVAGGGGGTEHVGVSSASVQGGSGGGTTGGIALSEAGNSTAATQTSGYAFGLGQSVNGTHMGSGGGGWYGGYCGTTSNTIGNGGSGYIGGVKNGVTENGKRGNNNIVGLDGLARITPLSHTHTDECYGGGGVGGYNCGLDENSEEIVKEFSYKGSIENITLSAGQYKLEVWGAQGGTSPNNIGGKGAYSSGNFTFNSSTTLQVLVGGQGSAGNGTGNWYAAGGGGGTYIASGNSYSTATPLIVAGGGGGAGYNNSDGEVGGAVVTPDGSTGTGGSGSGNGGSGGAGFHADGSNNSGSLNGSTFAKAFINGGNGALTTTQYGGSGGFGGGGIGGGNPGGGGGGYVGGDFGSGVSGNSSNYNVGGEGGTSYNIGSNEVNKSGSQTFNSPTGTSETGHSGNGYARITRLGHTHTEDCGYSSGGGTATTLTCGIPVGGDGQVRTYGTGGNTYNPTNGYGSTSTTLPAGRYKLEAWGPQGGDTYYNGGKGGYSVGELTLSSPDTLYINIGGQGKVGLNDNAIIEGGYNGGGRGYGSTNHNGASGGGATHIGYKTGLLTAFSSDYTTQLLIVAGGGGGGGNADKSGVGGYGGGTSGGNGIGYSSISYGYGAGGTQISGGTSGTGGTNSSQANNMTFYSGGFGYGGYSDSTSISGGWHGGGGGAGLYGGGAGGAISSGGGGSGYVNPNLLDSGTYETIAGNISFPNTAGTGNETGHSGNGFVKITTLDHQHTDACYTTVQIPDGYVLNCDKTKDHVHSMDAGCFIEFVGEDGLTVISSGNPAQFEVPLGNINVEAISKIVVYSKNCPNTFGKIYLKDDTGTYNENDSVTSNTITPNTENQVMTFILQDNPNFSGEFTSLMFELANVTGRFNISKIEVYGYGEKVAGTGDGSGNVGGTTLNFSYTGKTQTASLSKGSYKLEVWGAQGGNDPHYPTSVFGGRGGYASGILNLNNTTTLYVNVGGEGTGNTSSTWGSTGGGGATDISLYGTANTTNWNTTDHLYSRIIVAGGGGGVHGKNYASTSYVGNAGGGESSPTFTANNYTITGSNQISGGRSTYSQYVVGSFGYATANSNGNSYSTAGWNGASRGSDGWANGGAGGGWYGGTTSWSHSAGGSGWVYTESAYNYWATNSTEGRSGNWLLDSRYYLSDTSLIDGNHSMPSVNGGTETGHSGSGYARITPLNTFTPLEINYRDPFDGSSTIILANIDSIPDKLDGDYNPIWKCKFKEPNAHACVTTNDNGLEIVHCKTHVIFNCSEVHHRGEHYNVSNRICWSACGDDANHANTKTETKDKEGNDVKLAEFLQLDAAFTVYFPNVGDFEGNDALGLSKPQVDRGYGYDDNMDTTDWTREKRVKFPFDVIYHNKKTNKYEIHKGNAWIELDVPTVYFNFYILASNAEMQNVPVEFEVEAINGGTNSGVKPKRNIEYDSNIIDKKYEDALKNFRDNYVSKLKDSISGGYKIPYPNVTGTNSSSGVERAFNDSGYWSFYSTKQSSTGLDGVLRAAIDTINKQIENDFEGNTSSDSYIDPHENQGKTGVNNKLKKVTGNDNKVMLSNRRRSNSLESLHGGYKEFYLDVIGRIGNFALVDTEDYRFSEFFKVPVVSNTDLGALADEDNWLIEGAVLNVNPALQNYYVGDSFDIRGNEASLEAVDSLGTHYLNTYNTQSWMQGLIGADGKRDMSKPNLVSQILTSDLIHNRILKGEELRFGYDAYTSIVTLGSYTGARVQVVPKYFAMKLNDNPSEILDTKGQVVNANDFIPLDVYISKEGTYLPINIYGNAANGNPNINEYTLNGYSMNLDWTTEGDRRNYGIDEQGITNDVKAHLTRLDYGDRAEGSGGSFDSTPPLNTPDEIKLIIPEGKNNYLGTAQYMLMSDRHRTFIGSSVSFGGNTYKSRAGTSEWGDDKDPDNIIPDNLFKMAVQRWHGKLGVPSSAVFVPHAYKATGTPIADRNTTTLTPVNSETTSWVMNDDWAIICTAEIIAVGDVWSIYYSQPWFKTMTVSGQMYNTVTVGGEHYPGHRVYNDKGQSEECPHCLPPIIAIYSSDSSSVDDVEIVQTH